MDYVLLVVALSLSVALAIAIARAALGSLFWMMNEGGLPFVFHWNRVFFAGAIFWFWYLTPGIAESRAATRAMQLLAPVQQSASPNLAASSPAAR